jgi:alkylation response protein AidB-like acyl-CoA dehydrogenase
MTIELVDDRAPEATDHRPAAPGVEDIRAAVAPVLHALATRSRPRPPAGDDPSVAARELSRAGVARIGVPRDEGGAGGSLREVADIVIDVARADADVARSLRADFPVPEAAGDQDAWPDTWARLYGAAVYAGIAARVLDDAVWYVRERSRPIKHSSATASVDDPYVRQSVGEIAARAQTARAVVLLAAETLQGAAGGDRPAAAAAAVHVAQAGVIAL